MAINNNQNDVTLMDESGNSIQYARIQMRRGLESQFDVSKMLPAEFAVTTDTEKVHVAFSPGKTKQLMTVDDALEEVQEKADEILATLPEDYMHLEEKVSSLSEDLRYKTKNLKSWNLADISKAKQGYSYSSRIGSPLEQIENADCTLLDEVYEVEAGQQYTVNWLYGNLGIYDNTDKIIAANYIDSIPFTVTIPEGGVKMTLFGGTKRMVDIMLVEGNEIPNEYILHSIFNIENKKDHEQDKILEDLRYKTKNLKSWNLADISKAKQGYSYSSRIGSPLEQIENADCTLLDEVYEVEAGQQYTVNWLYGNLGIYDNTDKIIAANYIDSIPFTVTIPEGGVKMTLFGGTKRMVDIMLVEGNEIPNEYILHSIFNIENKKDHEQDKILESILHPLKGVKWCAYGNSLTDSATLASETSGTKNYVDYVSKSLELTVTNCGSGGTGFLKNFENKGTFVDRVSSIPLDTEILTVFGSFNDYEYISENLGTLGDTGTDTIYGAIYHFINDVYTRCPNVIMGIITPTKWGYLSEWKDASAAVLCDSYVDALLKTADKWSIPVLDLYHDSGLRPWDSNFAQLYYKDDDRNGTANTVHPLDAAHKRYIAPKVEAFIKRIYHVY